MTVVRIKNVKPRSPGTRWRRKIMFSKINSVKPKKFCFSQKWHAGRTVTGRVAYRTYCKRKYKKKIILNLVRLDARTTFVSQRFFFNFNTRKPSVLFWVKGGGSFVLPAVTTNLPGKLYYSWSQLVPTYTRSLAGVPVELHLVPFYMRISNVVDRPFIKYKYATSSGAYATKIRAPKREKDIKLIMPSGQFKYLNPKTLAISGLCLQYWLHKQVYGKAGIPRQHGKKQKVRGIAMNSCDHPHGGKANSVQPEKSPWGWVTKKSH